MTLSINSPPTDEVFLASFVYCRPDRVSSTQLKVLESNRFNVSSIIYPLIHEYEWLDKIEYVGTGTDLAFWLYELANKGPNSRTLP